ncbi:hypothetical protein LEL86_14675 [Streptomyces sp. WA6-1-16]|uniref:hypothetical protein n=1 Tax=Streptomyces TaxID=1883 RepID=UPI001CE3452A|nr:hypothetical protein [Streptomyces sp. WA6-1-16]UCA50458.1 hypothetical protein LEL86_14675 [Streptomyces sp. WA6-1-16]
MRYSIDDLLPGALFPRNLHPAVWSRPRGRAERSLSGTVGPAPSSRSWARRPTARLSPGPGKPLAATPLTGRSGLARAVPRREGPQCDHADWKGTTLQNSVESVVAKGGGSGGGSAGHHINSAVVYDACGGSVTSDEAPYDPYDPAITFTTGMFSWPNYAGTINDSHFVSRDRMGRSMAFVARAIEDGLITGGAAWSFGVDDGGSLFIDKNGLATAAGADTFVLLGDHRPEQADPDRYLTYDDYRIWRLRPGGTYDFKHLPTCGYYLRGVIDGIPDRDLCNGTPVTDCG